MVKKYEAMLKKFLSKKLSEDILSVEKVREIIVAAVSLEKEISINTESDIENAFIALEKNFHEIKELVDNFHYINLGKERRNLAQVVSAIAAQIVLTDIDRALEITTFASNPEVTVDSFYQKYPEFKDLNI